MRRSMMVWIAVIVAAAVVLVIFSASGGEDAPDYTRFSTRPKGVSLFYDTLESMGYPVATGYTAIDTACDRADVYIVIQPDDLSAQAVESMLDWVRAGGRLIYLADEPYHRLTAALAAMDFTRFGNLTHYVLAEGEIILGVAAPITNRDLMENSRDGAALQGVLQVWDANRIYFAEYYHGYRANEHFFSQLPWSVKCVVYQAVLCAAAFVWMAGKRRGKPLPYYDAWEREENEHVKALANILYRTERRRYVKRYRRPGQGATE